MVRQKHVCCYGNESSTTDGPGQGVLVAKQQFVSVINEGVWSVVAVPLGGQFVGATDELNQLWSANIRAAHLSCEGVCGVRVCDV